MHFSTLNDLRHHNILYTTHTTILYFLRPDNLNVSMLNVSMILMKHDQCIVQCRFSQTIISNQLRTDYEIKSKLLLVVFKHRLVLLSTLYYYNVTYYSCFYLMNQNRNISSSVCLQSSGNIFLNFNKRRNKTYVYVV